MQQVPASRSGLCRTKFGSWLLVHVERALFFNWTSGIPSLVYCQPSMQGANEVGASASWWTDGLMALSTLDARCRIQIKFVSVFPHCPHYLHLLYQICHFQLAVEYTNPAGFLSTHVYWIHIGARTASANYASVLRTQGGHMQLFAIRTMLLLLLLLL